jgi:hypothetical protein
MINFLQKLRQRNALLYYFGWLNLAGAMACVAMTFFDNTQVMGINAWIKPFKFFVSTVVFAWTMGWLMAYLNKKRSVTVYSIVIILIMTFELAAIVWQAANGRTSHFNITTPLYALLFSLMGAAIVMLILWTVYICVLFFLQKQFDIPHAYLWGIRLGLLFFIIFSFEGGMMAAQLSHTVGADDGGEGLPIVNWSRQHGDLRIAHFIGMHALQVLPLAGYFVFRKTAWLVVFALAYFAFTTLLMIMALKGMPLIKY